MSEIKNGGPAFPGKASINRSTGELQAHQFGNNDFETLGMTLRDYFAAKAMVALINNEFCAQVINEVVASGNATRDDIIAEVAYTQADAMLRARGEA
ncbi:hypothetical protein LGN12_12490 [Burkholderia multivorans]|nr:hypothetical protein [Burkholderia multivorans]